MDFNALGAIQGILQNAGSTVNKDLQMQMTSEQMQQEQMQALMAQESEKNDDLPNVGKEGTTSSTTMSSDAIGLTIGATVGGAMAGVIAGLVALVGFFTALGASMAAVFGIGAIFLVLAAVIAVVIFAIVEAIKDKPHDGFVTKGPEITQYDTGKQSKAQNAITQLGSRVSQLQQEINQTMQQFVNPDQSALTSLENMWTSINQQRQQLVGNW